MTYRLFRLCARKHKMQNLILAKYAHTVATHILFEFQFF